MDPQGTAGAAGTAGEHGSAVPAAPPPPAYYVQGPPPPAAPPLLGYAELRPTRRKGRYVAWVAGALGLVLAATVVTAGVRALDQSHSAQRAASPPVGVDGSTGPTSGHRTAEQEPWSVGDPLPAVLTSVRPTGSDVIPPELARQLFADLWSIRGQSMAAAKSATLRQIETGAALHGDLHRIRCQCLFHPGDATLDRFQVYASRQSGWPAQFFAQTFSTDLKGSATREYYVVTRSGLSDGWRISFASYGVGGSTDFFPAAVDAQGYEKKPSPAARRHALTEPGRLAALWEHAVSTGHPASLGEFADGGWTSEISTQLAAANNTVPWGRERAHRTLSFRLAPHQPEYVFALSGATMVCADIKRTVRVEPRAHHVLVQSALEPEYGAEVAPGDYREITGTGYCQSCLVVESAIGSVDVHGGDGPEEMVYRGVPAVSADT